MKLKLRVLFVLFLLFSWPVDISSEALRKRNRAELVTDVYHGCGFDKYCLKICHPTQPSCRKCIAEYNCPAMVTVEFRDEKYESQMIIQTLGLSPEFISMGLSLDNRMGNDPVVVCVVMNGAESKWNMFGAWTTGLKTMDYDVKVFPYYDLTHTYIDGTYVCGFQWKKEFKMKDKDYNINSEAYYLIAARGEAASYWVINGHQKSEVARVCATENVTLLSVPELEDYDERFEDQGVCHHISIILLTVCLILQVVYIGRQKQV